MALLGAVAIVGIAAADPTTESTYKPTKKYKSSSGSGKIFDTPEAACQDSVAGLAKNGNKQTLVKVGPGSSEWSDTCVLKPADGKVWDQTDAITVLEKCQDGTDSHSSNNSGTIDSQVCACDPAKGCPVTPPTTDDCAAADQDDRCYQDPKAAKRTQQQADRMSAANKAKTQRTHGDMAAKYKAAEDEIRGEQEKVNRARYKNATAKGFPEFSPGDLCKAQVNQVNIGMLCGFDEGDFKAANALAGYDSTPKDCTWHHSEDLGQFVLLNRSNHAESPHWGGRSIWKRAFNVPYPGHCKKK